MTALVVGVVLDGGREQGVDKGGLSQAGFTSDLYVLMSILAPSIARYPESTNHDSEGRTPLGDNLVPE